jgi:hypothetical protein
LYSWTPGSAPFVAPASEARLLIGGSQLVFEVHYAPNGKATSDQSRMGIVFAKPPKRRVLTIVSSNESIGIPPGEPNYENGTCLLITREITLVSLKPHMHLRGRDMRFDLEDVDGQKSTLLFVPKWDFNWQLTYQLRTPRVLKPGARIHILAHFDNSARNKANPDPTKYVIWDDQSTGEMLSGMITVSEPNP